MAAIIFIKCLKTIIRNKNVLKIYTIIIFFIKYILYKIAHDRTILILCIRSSERSCERK